MYKLFWRERAYWIYFLPKTPLIAMLNRTKNKF